jgi:hypothetical protein
MSLGCPLAFVFSFSMLVLFLWFKTMYTLDWFINLKPDFTRVFSLKIHRLVYVHVLLFEREFLGQPNQMKSWFRHERIFHSGALKEAIGRQDSHVAKGTGRLMVPPTRPSTDTKQVHTRVGAAREVHTVHDAYVRQLPSRGSPITVTRRTS